MAFGRLIGATLTSGILISCCTSLCAAAADEVCAKSTWANCGMVVKAELDRQPNDPKRIINLAGLWAASYDKQYDFLRSRGRLERSTPDAEKIFAEVESKVDPIDIVSDQVKDKVLEVAVKRYFSRLAPLLKFASSPLAAALKVFFESSEIASDYDELRLMNDDLQTRITTQLSPYLKADWKARLNSAVQEAAPSLQQR
jgi:hypothetical protein